MKDSFRSSPTILRRKNKDLRAEVLISELELPRRPIAANGRRGSGRLVKCDSHERLCPGFEGAFDDHFPSTSAEKVAQPVKI